MTRQQELELLAEWLGIDIAGAWHEGPVEGLFIPSVDDYWNPSPEGNDTDFLNMVADKCVDFVWYENEGFLEARVFNDDVLSVARDTHLSDHNNDKLTAMKHAAYQVCLMAAREWKDSDAQPC